MASEHLPMAGEHSVFGRQWPLTMPKEALEKACRFHFESSDIIVNTFPRTGTIITQEIIWHLLHRDSTPEEATKSINLRFPQLELDTEYHPNFVNPFEIFRTWGPGPRLIKTHCSPDLLDDSILSSSPKVFFNLRNPKDTAVSLFHFYRGISIYEWKHDWNDFFRLFMSGRTFSGDYFQTSRERWALRDKGNVMILKYEDIVRQPHQEIHRIAAHLGIPDITPDDIAAVIKATSFDSMRVHPGVTRKDPVTGFSFIRKGVIGNWKNYFTPEQNRQMDKAIHHHFSADGPHFDYE